jgi:hypothetical protein
MYPATIRAGSMPNFAWTVGMPRRYSERSRISSMIKEALWNISRTTADRINAGGIPPW